MAIRNFLFVTLCILPSFAQAQPRPIYKITVVQRETPAINYGHRTIPTKIDFRGTPLVPQAHGDATIEYKHGATIIDAHFNNIPPPNRFGAQYLTYVVWSISPEGRAQSIGELIVDGNNKGRVLASTPMQTFALIVTAEPYFSVAQPGDAVVMENALRPDTVGDVRTVNATYDLLPRKEFTYNLPPAQTAPTTPPVSQSEYEALMATYQARNAIQIATAAGAERWASDEIRRAQQIYNRAAQMPRNTLGLDVVAQMREAAQIAEDARAVSVQRAQIDGAEQARARQVAEHEAERVNQPDPMPPATPAPAPTPRASVEPDRTMARMTPPVPTTTPLPAIQRPPEAGRETRAMLRQRLSTAGFQTLDTPRGLVVLVPNLLLESAPEAVTNRLSVVASTLLSYPSLRVEVDGNTDNARSESTNREVSQMLAARVREALVRQGVNPGVVSAIGYGSSRPTAPNQSPMGRQQNRRVEIVISGNVIGSMPVWDRPYTLEHRAMPR